MKCDDPTERRSADNGITVWTQVVRKTVAVRVERVVWLRFWPSWNDQLRKRDLLWNEHVGISSKSREQNQRYRFLCCQKGFLVGRTSVVTEPEVTTIHLKNTASPASVHDMVLPSIQVQASDWPCLWFGLETGPCQESRAPALRPSMIALHRQASEPCMACNTEATRKA